MNDVISILPPSLASDSRSRVLEELSKRMSSLDLAALLVYLIDTVSITSIPVLAEQFNLYGSGWELAESEEARRQLIKTAVRIKKRNGTPWAIRQVFRSLGLGEITLIEGVGDVHYDGSACYDGTFYHGDKSKWAVYVIKLSQPVTRDQATAIRTMLEKVAPARCQLGMLNYTEAANRYNGKINYDGLYNHGVA